MESPAPREVSASHALQHRLFFFDDRLEARPREHALDVGSQSGPALRIDFTLSVAEAHELDAGRDVGDRELVSDQPIIVTEFALLAIACLLVFTLGLPSE